MKVPSAKMKNIKKKEESKSIVKHDSERNLSLKTNVDRKKDIERKQQREVRFREVKVILNRIEVRETAEIQRRENERKARLIMTEFIKRPNVLSFEGNLSENWRCFQRDFGIFMRAAELNAKSDAVRINLFLNAVGQDALEVYESLQLTEAQRENYDMTVAAFEAFCNQRKNTVYERFKFYQRKQKDGEPFDSFHMDLKKLVKNCEFGERQNEALRDQIVIGVSDTKLQTTLLETTNLSYDTAVQKSRAKEVTKEQTTNMNGTMANMNEIRSTNSQNRCEIKRDEPTNNNYNSTQRNTSQRGRAHYTQTQHTPAQQQQQQRNTNHTNTQQRQNNNYSGRNTNNNNQDLINCRRCNLTHRVRSCPAFGKTCNACSKLNHFAICCNTRRNISTIENDNDYESTDENDDFYIGTLDVCSAEIDSDATAYPWTEKIEVKGSEIPFKIDTGAEMNVLPLRELKRQHPEIELQRTSVTLRAFGGQKIRPVGMCFLDSVYNGVSLKTKYAIVDLNIVSILGLKTCIDFKIVQPSKESKKMSVQNADRND